MRNILWIILWTVGIIHRGGRIGNVFQWFRWMMMMMMMMMMMQDVQHVHVSWYVQHFLHMMGFNFMSLSAAFLAESERLAQTASREDVVVSCSRFFFKRQRWIIHQERCSSKLLQELVQKTNAPHGNEACSRWCLNHETCSKGLKPAKRIVVLFCSPYSKRGKPQTCSAIQSNFPSEQKRSGHFRDITHVGCVKPLTLGFLPARKFVLAPTGRFSSQFLGLSGLEDTAVFPDEI